ncbi:MAG: hypothetical protein FJ004_06510 [Chloroflexi bacterium]|nr:hypothetical protein [Chloroflexota bacterium]
MKILRGVLILTLVAALTLCSMGTVFAKGPPADNPGKGPKNMGERQGFSGNVTAVIAGNVTLITEQGWNVTVTLNNDARYKIVKAMNKWGSYDDFIDALGGSLTALMGEKVVVLAGNVTETAPPGTFTGVAIKFMVLKIPATPLHAHRTGLVSVFNPPGGSIATGNITIVDVHGVSHLFTVGNETIYRPAGTEAGNITADATLQTSSFVTVVTKGDPKLNSEAKAIVLHANRPADWPKP